MNTQHNTKHRGEQKDPPEWIFKAMSKSHVFLNRVTGGKLFNTFKGDEVCFVTMRGAKSGKRITMPLMFVPHDRGILLVASKGGSPKNPAWYHNIVKNPELEVRHRGKIMHVRARLANRDEKNDLWPVCEAHYAEYADYRKKTERDIPIFICKPLDEALATSR